MKTLTFYFNIDAAVHANLKRGGRVNWQKFVRVKSSSTDDLTALERSHPKRGETMLNTVTIEE